MNGPPRDPAGRTAEVVACGRRIRYARRGAGSPVVLLGAAELGGPLRADLVEALASRFRVFEPEAGEDAADLCWLPPFLEGLGLHAAGLVAAGRFRDATPCLAREVPDLVSGVVLLGEAPEAGLPVDGLDTGLLVDRPEAGLLVHGPEAGLLADAPESAAAERPGRLHRVETAGGGPCGSPRKGAAHAERPALLRVDAADPDRPALLGRITAFLSGAAAARSA